MTEMERLQELQGIQEEIRFLLDRHAKQNEEARSILDQYYSLRNKQLDRQEYSEELSGEAADAIHQLDSLTERLNRLKCERDLDDKQITALEARYKELTS